MKKFAVMILSLLLTFCVVLPTLADITPYNEVRIKQGEKVTFTASWPLNLEVIKVQWTMDGKVVWEKKVNEKKSPYASSYTLHAQQFDVKYNDNPIGHYELCCFLYDKNGPQELWADIQVYIEPRTP